MVGIDRFLGEGVAGQRAATIAAAWRFTSQKEPNMRTLKQGQGTEVFEPQGSA